MELPWITGWSGFAVLVVAWLVVSFSAPSPRRDVVEWIGASALYVILVSIFSGLLGDALAEESTLRTIAFGFLVVFFGVGLVLCLVQTLSALRGPRRTVSSATN